MNRSRRWSSILALAATGAVLATFPTCSGTKHTVARIVEYIHAGDAYQVVPSQRWTAPLFPLKAADFMKRGVPQGPALGDRKSVV